MICSPELRAWSLFLAITISGAVFCRAAIATVVSGHFVFQVVRKTLLQSFSQAILMASASTDFFSRARDFARSAALLQEAQLEAADADAAQGGVLVSIHTNDYLASEALDQLSRKRKNLFMLILHMTRLAMSAADRRSLIQRAMMPPDALSVAVPESNFKTGQSVVHWWASRLEAQGRGFPNAHTKVMIGLPLEIVGNDSDV
jgi:hypothetical protein